MSPTAILIFARTHAFESKCKPLTVNDAQLYLNLNKRVISLAKRIGLPYFISDETNQVGDSFGEKLTNAVSGVFDSGFDKVIILGNDCPQLSLQCLKQTESLLQTNKMVLGPDRRGGAYLIGINKYVFEKHDFSSLEWQTKNLFNNLQQLSTAIVLPFLPDINDLGIIKFIVKCLPFSSAIKKVLLSLLYNGDTCHTLFFTDYISNYTVNYFSLRAPPLSLFF